MKRFQFCEHNSDVSKKSGDRQFDTMCRVKTSKMSIPNPRDALVGVSHSHAVSHALQSWQLGRPFFRAHCALVQ